MSERRVSDYWRGALEDRAAVLQRRAAHRDPLEDLSMDAWLALPEADRQVVYQRAYGHEIDDGTDGRGAVRGELRRPCPACGRKLAGRTARLAAQRGYCRGCKHRGGRDD